MAKFTIKKSTIHGVGTFATETISVGTNIGLALSEDENTSGLISFNRTMLARYINHADNGNVFLKKFGKDYYFIANKSIENGQELLTNYADYDSLMELEGGTNNKTVKVR